MAVSDGLSCRMHVSFLLKFFLFAALIALAGCVGGVAGGACAGVRLLPDGYRQAVHRAAKTAAWVCVSVSLLLAAFRYWLAV